MTTYTSDERRNTGPECQTMSDVRFEVDRIDRLLVKILAERQTYMDAAARIKDERGKVVDSARVEDVVAKVLGCAEQEGLSPAIAEPVWRTLIDRSIAHELVVWDRSREKTAT